VVECAFPGALVDGPIAVIPGVKDAPRTALARWLTRPEHPLTARVIVNRLWQWHFGRGLSATPSDFGTMGAEPTHPELLDWLALRFVSNGWSMKQMHRLIVTSRTYRTASVPYDSQWSEADVMYARTLQETNNAADPDNLLWWHRPLARLDGEAIRDAMLVASGKLSGRRGGPGVRPRLAPEITQTLLRGQWEPSGDAEDYQRRSVYLFVRRNLRYPMFDVFDRPDTNASCPQRHVSTTATQSLTQFNSEFSLKCAKELAASILRQRPADSGNADREAIAEVHQRVFNRPATEADVSAALSFLSNQSARLCSSQIEVNSSARPGDRQAVDQYRGAALADYCRALFNANAFLYVE
jgi:hypothetical protein